MGNTNMTQEQLIATFGPEVGAQMWGQMNAGTAGGNQAPFSFVKKVATHGSELGEFGDFCINVKTEKQPDGTRAITDKGTNLGKGFDFVIVNVSYKYTKWDDVKNKTIQSNMFSSLDGIKTAVDVYTGEPLPESKQDKKDEGWSLIRVNAGLIRKNSKSPWEPVIWETKGTMYFTLGEVVAHQPNKGLMDGIIHIATKLDAKGATQFSVIDVDASSVSPLPKDFFDPNGKTAPMLADITSKMTEYVKGAQYNSSAATASSNAAPAQEESDDTNW